MLCCCTACSLHAHNAWPFTGIAPNNGQPVCSRPTIRSLFCPRKLRLRRRRRWLVCACVSCSPEEIAPYIIYIFIYVFHPLIDTHRLTYIRLLYIVANISGAVPSHFISRRRLRVSKINRLDRCIQWRLFLGGGVTGPILRLETIHKGPLKKSWYINSSQSDTLGLFDVTRC